MWIFPFASQSHQRWSNSWVVKSDASAFNFKPGSVCSAQVGKNMWDDERQKITKKKIRNYQKHIVILGKQLHVDWLSYPLSDLSVVYKHFHFYLVLSLSICIFFKKQFHVWPDYLILYPICPGPPSLSELVSSLFCQFSTESTFCSLTTIIKIF